MKLNYTPEISVRKYYMEKFIIDSIREFRHALLTRSSYNNIAASGI